MNAMNAHLGTRMAPRQPQPLRVGRVPCPRMPRRRGVAMGALALLILVAGFVAGWPRGAAAHPLGNFTINRYARVEPGAGAIRVVYVLDMAEIPTFQEMETLDRNGDRTVSEAERQAWLHAKLPELARGLRLTVNGQRLALEPEPGSALLTLAEGQGALPVLRVDAVFIATLPAGVRGTTLAAQLRDTNYDNRLGWKEIVVRGTAEATVTESSAPAQDRSDALRAYPEELIQSPPDVREVRFRLTPGVPDPAPGGDARAATAMQMAERTGRAARPGNLESFARSAARSDLSLPVALVALVAAVFWGALHALGPGHGKTVVGAYLVGSRGTAKHAIILGLTVTATHTAGVYLLGLVTLSASHIIVPERLYPILSLASGVLVIGMGASLLWARLRAVRGRRQETEDRRHAGGTVMRGAVSSRIGMPVTQTAALSGTPVLVTAGATATPVAYGVGHAHGRPHHRSLAAAQPPRLWHDHGDGRAHSHTVPGMGGTPVTWRGLLALGIYGGLIPCPTAIVVLLTSIALNRVAFGLLLVVAFSAGLAAVLTGIGLALVFAGQRLQRFRVDRRIALAVPVLSAAAVVLVGVLITLRAVGQL